MKPLRASGHDARRQAFHRVHAVAPLKREERRREVGLVFLIPPRSRGGPIEAVLPSLLRRRVQLSFHRVHAVAPLKPGKVCVNLRERDIIPPRSRGGPIEAGQWAEREIDISFIPPRSRGGPIEAKSSACSLSFVTSFHRVHAVAPLKHVGSGLALRRSAAIPPRSRGGPIEAPCRPPPPCPPPTIPPRSRGGPIEARSLAN